MTRCVIDSDGLFVEEQYFDDGRQSIEAAVPEVGEHQAAKWTGSGWEILPDYRGCLVYTKHGEQVWSQPGDLPDGVSLEPKVAANLAAAKAAKLAEINVAAQSFVDGVAASSKVPDFEVATWPLQATEAQAWAANPATETPVLAQIAAARGLDLDKLRTAALKKSQAYTALTASVAGQRQALVDKLDKAKTTAAVEKITVNYTYEAV